MLGRPRDSAPLTIKSLALAAGKASDVGLLGSRDKPRWNQTAEGLIVTLPANTPCEIAYALKISWHDSTP